MDLLITKAVVVEAPLATAVRHWPGTESRHVPDAVVSFQSLADDRTRVILSVRHLAEAPVDVLDVLLEGELERFKEEVEAGPGEPYGVAGLLRRLLP